MAKSKTPAKRARRAEANRLRNKSEKSRLNTELKKYEATLKGNDVEAASENLRKVSSLIDKGAKSGILHKNTAARRKSALAKKLNSINA